jgi:hypothetical protein
MENVGVARIRALTRWHVQLHPDVNKDADANEKFMSVRLAYEVRMGHYLPCFKIRVFL